MIPSQIIKKIKNASSLLFRNSNKNLCLGWRQLIITEFKCSVGVRIWLWGHLLNLAQNEKSLSIQPQIYLVRYKLYIKDICKMLLYNVRLTILFHLPSIYLWCFNIQNRHSWPWYIWPRKGEFVDVSIRIQLGRTKHVQMLYKSYWELPYPITATAWNGSPEWTATKLQFDLWQNNFPI